MVAPNELIQAQRDLAKCALEVLPEFALAGSGAIREHGLIDRPTEDVDLFSTFDEVGTPDDFSASISRLCDALIEAGYSVQKDSSGDFFQSLTVTKDGVVLQMDMGVDFRSFPPAMMSLGPVINRDDAVGSKVAAMFSRGEARDYLDVDRIRSNSNYSDKDLFDLACEVDAGLDEGLFIQSLEWSKNIKLSQVEKYGYTAENLEQLQERFSSWAKVLREKMRADIQPVSLRREAEEAKRASKVLNAQRCDSRSRDAR